VHALEALANVVQVVPAAGSSVDDVKRAMFGLPGVASVQPVSAMAQVLRDLIEQMGGSFTVIESFALAPATVLAAFAFGTVAALLAPLLTARKLRRMDIPSTLRVME